jgi:hypothetical protein
MPKALTFTWQQRGEYLARCMGCEPSRFATRLDAQIMRETTSNIAGASVSGSSLGTGGRPHRPTKKIKATRKSVTTRKASVPAGGTSRLGSSGT